MCLASKDRNSHAEQRAQVAMLASPGYFFTIFQYSANDIALYKSNVRFGQRSFFMPICLPGQKFAFKSGAASVGGWGKKTDENTNKFQNTTEYGIAGDSQKCMTSGCESIRMN